MLLTPPHSRRSAAGLHVGRSVVATLMALGFAAGAARAQAVDPNLWVTNGPVYAIATTGNILYLGGDFTTVGPITGHFVGIDAVTGAPEPGWPRVVPWRSPWAAHPSQSHPR